MRKPLGALLYSPMLQCGTGSSFRIRGSALHGSYWTTADSFRFRPTAQEICAGRPLRLAECFPAVHFQVNY